MSVFSPGTLFFLSYDYLAEDVVNVRAARAANKGRAALLVTLMAEARMAVVLNIIKKKCKS
jgi:hypothetical protein